MGTLRFAHPTGNHCDGRAAVCGGRWQGSGCGARRVGPGRCARPGAGPILIRYRGSAPRPAVLRSSPKLGSAAAPRCRLRRAGPELTTELGHNGSRRRRGGGRARACCGQAQRHTAGVVVPGAPADNPVRASGIGAPLPDVAGQVGDAGVGATGRHRFRPPWCRRPTVVIGQIVGWLGVAPGIDTPIGAARRPLPLQFGRQADDSGRGPPAPGWPWPRRLAQPFRGHPAAIGVGLVPAHAHHRAEGAVPLSVAPIAGLVMPCASRQAQPASLHSSRRA
jgi:hypothetical protein